MKTVLFLLVSFLLIASSCAVLRPSEQAPPKYRRYYQRHQRVNSRHRQTTSVINN